MFYEAWGQPLSTLLTPLLPGIACFILCIVALRWPRLGGTLLIVFAAVVGVVWLNEQAGRRMPAFQLAFTLIVMNGPIILTGFLFVLEARHRRLLRVEGAKPSPRWIARNYRYVLVAGLPLLAFALVLAQKLPQHLSRLDDGLRGPRVIEGNGVSLVWAPQGPGWNWKLSDDRYPSWDAIARYGDAPVGLDGKSGPDRDHAMPAEMERTCLCAYLNEGGTMILAKPTHIWRMPTADEIVRSLTRDGENAGCVWDGQSPHTDCGRPPDKETPLWAPDEPPIYYWAAGEFDTFLAFCVNYTGGVNRQPKSLGGRSVGFRCVKEAALPSGGR
jgi:hypothetical protein